MVELVSFFIEKDVKLAFLQFSEWVQSHVNISYSTCMQWKNVQYSK